MDCWVSQDWDMDTIHIILEVLILLGGLNLAKTKILAKYNTVNQVDHLQGDTKPAHVESSRPTMWRKMHLCATKSARNISALTQEREHGHGDQATGSRDTKGD